jgi:hypothetical protein
LKTLFSSSKKVIPEEIICITYDFLSTSLKRKENVDTISQSIEFIFNELLVKHTHITSEEFELRQTNPKNYIYKLFDQKESGVDKRQSVSNFIRNLIQFKNSNKEQPYLNIVLSFFYNALNFATEKKDFISKEALMFILESSHDLISKKSSNIIEELLSSFILKDLEVSLSLL